MTPMPIFRGLRRAPRPLLRGLRRFSTGLPLGGEAAAVPLFINNKMVLSKSTQSVPVRCPATQTILAHTPLATQAEMQAAVDAARAAYPKWSRTSVSNRARVMLKLQALIRERTDDLAALISAEHGKTIDDAKGDIFRGLEVVEHACAITPNSPRHISDYWPTQSRPFFVYRGDGLATSSPRS